MYSRFDFGKDLEEELKKDFDIKKLSKWAYVIYLDKKYSDRQIINSVIFKIMAMEEGDEFLLTKEELLDIARELQDK